MLNTEGNPENKRVGVSPQRCPKNTALSSQQIADFLIERGYMQAAYRERFILLAGPQRKIERPQNLTALFVGLEKNSDRANFPIEVRAKLMATFLMSELTAELEDFAGTLRPCQTFTMQDLRTWHRKKRSHHGNLIEFSVSYLDRKWDRSILAIIANYDELGRDLTERCAEPKIDGNRIEDSSIIFEKRQNRSSNWDWLMLNVLDLKIRHREAHKKIQLYSSQYPGLSRLFAEGLGEAKTNFETIKLELEKLGKTIR